MPIWLTVVGLYYDTTAEYNPAPCQEHIHQHTHTGTCMHTPTQGQYCFLVVDRLGSKSSFGASFHVFWPITDLHAKYEVRYVKMISRPKSCPPPHPTTTSHTVLPLLPALQVSLLNQFTVFSKCWVSTIFKTGLTLSKHNTRFTQLDTQVAEHLQSFAK